MGGEGPDGGAHGKKGVTKNAAQVKFVLSIPFKATVTLVYIIVAK